MVNISHAVFLVLFLRSAANAHTASSSLSAAAEAREHALIQEWSKDLNGIPGQKGEDPHSQNVAYKKPIKRVTNLLEKMKAELTAEAENEAAMYDKMVCWCDTNEKEKTKAIKDADARDKELSAEIASRSAALGEAVETMRALKEQIAEDTEILKKATAIREKEAAEFMESEKDSVQAITNLKNAVAVLGRHQGGSSLLQVNKNDGPLVTGMTVLLRDLAFKYEMLLARGRQSRGSALLSIAQEGRKEASKEPTLTSALLAALDVHSGPVSDALPLNFAEDMVANRANKAGSFLQKGSQPKFAAYKSYNARSDGIFGILSQMLEEFEADLSESQKEELKAREDFEALKAAKEAQIAAGKEKLDEVEEENADNIKALSDAKEDLDLTRKQRSEDVKFLRNLKVTCQDLDHQWEQRSATRAAELKAVNGALNILLDDDNRELLHSVKTTFLQVATVSSEESRMMALRKKAVAYLKHAAKSPSLDADELLSEWHNRDGKKMSSVSVAGARNELSTLALSVQLDSFTKVKEAMDQMVEELKKQQTEEAAFKAFCIKELDETEQTTYRKDQLKKDLLEKIDSLEANIAKLEDDIAKAKATIADTKVAIKKASQTREAENKEFQATVADQRAVQDIMGMALMKLKDFYVKGIGKETLIQKQTPPVQFNKYADNAGGSPVMGLLEQIIGDSQKLEKECTDGEYKAQKDYETFVNDSNDLINSLNDEITAKTKAVSQAKKDLAETKEHLQATMDELEALAKLTADLHGQCDFTLKNFDIRQKARLQEIEAIQAAKAILSGEQ